MSLNEKLEILSTLERIGKKYKFMIMKEEIDIVAILKDKPLRTKLWSPMFGECEIRYINGVIYNSINVISTYSLKSYEFTRYGRFSEKGECVIFPSKKMRDWSKFAWKKGDVLANNKFDYKVFFDKWGDDTYTWFYGQSEHLRKAHYDTANCALVSEEVANSFIKIVEELHNGKLNLETLEIEKPKQEFKDGDVVRVDDEILIILKRDEVFDTYYHFFFRSNGTTAFDGSFGKCTRKYRLATDSEKQQLFDALAKEGKRWDEDKKMLVDLPKKCELKPFDKVLVRDTDAGVWMPTLFGFYDKEFNNYVCLNDVFQKCIPYNDSTKHLLGTTDEWEGGEE